MKSTGPGVAVLVGQRRIWCRIHGRALLRDLLLIMPAQMTKEERYKIACANFLTQHPEVARELDALSPREAEILGLSIDEFRHGKLAKHLASHANSQGIDSAELVIDLAARSEPERKAMLLERHKEIALHLHIGWEDYRDLNPHVKDLG